MNDTQTNMLCGTRSANSACTVLQCSYFYTTVIVLTLHSAGTTCVLISHSIIQSIVWLSVVVVVVVCLFVCWLLLYAMQCTALGLSLHTMLCTALVHAKKLVVVVVGCLLFVGCGGGGSSIYII